MKNSIDAYQKRKKPMRSSCEEIRELLTAKNNVDRLLKMDEEQKKE